ncbi:MAG: M17 family metallopeptidase, partial [bacterium]
LFPADLAYEASTLASDKVKITIFDEKQLGAMSDFERRPAGLLLGVGMSSAHPPRLVAISINNGPAGQAPIALVGKGITFDTGGVNVKPWKGMRGMRLDMSGAAAVLGALKAIIDSGLQVNVLGVLACAENAIGPDALRPSDVVTALDGTPVEIAHTDAEGRLVLGDALCYTSAQRPAVILDAATLTGSAAIALGPLMGGLFTEDDDFARSLIRIGQEAGEPYWRLPMTEEYEGIVEGTLGEISNVGKYDSEADATAGAFFLRHFVTAPEGQPKPRWAHLDIAPIDRFGPGSELNGELGSGAAVRLFYGAVEAYANGTL